jgi:hypothetical protein
MWTATGAGLATTGGGQCGGAPLDGAGRGLKGVIARTGWTVGGRKTGGL